MSGIILPFKNLLLRVGAFTLLLFGAFTSMAQSENVGIGTTNPDNSALLDLSSNSKGLLIPRMTLAQRAGIENPATGLIVYQLDFFTGFYFFDGSSWKGLYARNTEGAALTAAEPTNSYVSSSANENSWNTGGNSGLNADLNFIGTLDTTSLVFKVNNYRSGLIDYRFGNTYLGYRAGYRSHGFNSIAIGAYALHDANLGLNNIAIGYQSLLSSKTGSNNIALGANALISSSTGSQNIGIGTQAGQKSVGDGNIFIGHKAGMNEVGDNKLYIDNGFQDKPLLYGDFATGRLGINTLTPSSSLSINSRESNSSGLAFEQLTSDSPAEKSNLKVLSVDKEGRVILVSDSVGTSTTNTLSYWAAKGSSVENINPGDVIVSNLRFKNLRTISPAIKSNLKVLTVDDNGLIVLARDSVNSSPNYWKVNANILSNTTSGKMVLNGPIQFNDIKASNKAFRSYGKVLTVDDNGNVILVKDSVGTGSATGGLSPWTISGNDIVNSNIGKTYINNGLSVKSGINIESGNLVTNGSVTNRSGLVLNQLKLSFPASKPSGKVLSVDDNGNVILVRDSVGVAGTVINAPSPWTVSGDNISNANTGSVSINALNLPQLSSNNTPTLTTQKVLSVDANGNVILVNTPTTTSSTTPTSELWKANNAGMISNNNTQGVVITANNDGTSGLQFAKLKSSSAAGNRYGKVLSVDDNGNVILINDGITSGGGNNTGTGWTLTDGRLHNINNAKVVIGTGINSFPGNYGLYVEKGILTERVRVAVANSDRWADYVFQKDYNLMSLHDVEKHINYYQHLPNVPSADQMVKSGMDVMETSAKLLEKIEELTLYLIKANKQIEALENKVSNLEKVQNK